MRRRPLRAWRKPCRRWRTPPARAVGHAQRRRTWRELSLHGWLVGSVAVGGGRVIAAVTRCLAQTPRCGRFRVYSAPVTANRWRPVPGAAGTVGVFGGGVAPPQVTVAAGTGFVTSANYGPGLAPSPLLTGPADGSARWHRLGTPCSRWTLSLAAAPGLALALGCTTGQPAGAQLQRAYLSTGGGSAWQRLAAMTTDTLGFVIEPWSGGGSIWFTYDDAHTWHLVTPH